MLKLNSRVMVLVCLVLLFAIVTNLFLDQESASNNRDAAGNDPDVYMQNATITQYLDDGFRHHAIFAERFSHFPLNDMTTLYVPSMTLFSSEGNQPWEVTAEHGRLLPKTASREETIELWGQVRANQQMANGNFISVQTNSLTIYPENEYAETNQQVIIDNHLGRTSAAGMKVYFARGHISFFSSLAGKKPDEQTRRKAQRVQTIVLPKFKQEAE